MTAQDDKLGDLTISNIRTFGRFDLEARQAKSGNLKLDGTHVERADARLATHHTAAFGVEILIGGLTILNAFKNNGSKRIFEANNLSGGTTDHPLRGSGISAFGGAYIPTDAGMSTAPAPTFASGSIRLSHLSTDELHSDGGIPKGIGNLITGGVFIGFGVDAEDVANKGPVTTYGPNDRVLDNWGDVAHWTVKIRRDVPWR